MTDDEKARFEALIKLRDFWQARWVSRRDFAWKGTLGAWALLAGCTYAVKNRPPDIQLAIGLAVFVVTFCLLWVREIQVRDFRDSRRAFHFNSLAEAIMFPSTAIEPKPAEPGVFTFLQDGLALVQVLGTALLALGVFHFMGQLG